MQQPRDRVRIRFVPAISTILAAASLLLGFMPVAAQACNWTGTWRRIEGTGTAVVTLTQTGNQVTGDDGFGDQVSGMVSGNRFTGRWTHGSDGGALDLTMESSCNRLSGTFGWPPPRPAEPFNATRLSGAPAAPTAAPAAPTSAPPPTPAPPAPAPPAPPPVSELGPLNVDAYCQSFNYTLDIGGVLLDLYPYDGAVADGSTVYCAAFNVFESGIDVYSDPLDLREACLWQYGQTAGVRQDGANPPSWSCTRP